MRDPIIEALIAKVLTHMYILGPTGVGKSQFLRSLFRKALDTGCGLVLLDWKGDLYHEILRDLTYFGSHRKIVLLDAATGSYTVPYNPIASKTYDDPGVHASRNIDLAVKAWHAKDTNQTPLLEKILRIVFHYMIASGESLANAAQLLIGSSEILEHALHLLSVPEHDVAYGILRRLSNGNAREWREAVGSTESRLARFFDARAMRRVLGAESKLDMQKLLDENAIVLVSLGQSSNFYADSARVLAAWILNDIFLAARLRSGTRKRTIIFLDEFQQFLTDDLADMLDQVRAGGCSVVMAHQHLGHLLEDQKLMRSIFTNARIKAVFGGLDYQSAKTMVEEILLNKVNEREIKETYHRQEVEKHELERHPTASATNTWANTKTSVSSFAVHEGESEHDQQTSHEGEGRTEFERDTPFMDVLLFGQAEPYLSSALSRQSGTGSGNGKGSNRGMTFGDADGEANTAGGSATLGETLMMRPTYREVVAGRAEWTREERLSMIAEALIALPNQKCMLKLQGYAAEVYSVPFVVNYFIRKANVLKYEAKVSNQVGGISNEEQDRFLEESHDRFMRDVSGKRLKVIVSTRPPKV